MGDPKKKVLVVDDDPQLVDLLTLALHDAGYEVASTGDGAEAIRRAVTSPPDVIVLDVALPGRDGWEVADYLLSHNGTTGTPIIFLTARNQRSDQLRGWYAGCFDYLTKPFDVEVLLNRVRAATTEPSERTRQLAAELRRQKIARLEAVVSPDAADDESSDERNLGRPTA